jgi:hypothetical protein
MEAGISREYEEATGLVTPANHVLAHHSLDRAYEIFKNGSMTNLAETTGLVTPANQILAQHSLGQKERAAYSMFAPINESRLEKDNFGTSNNVYSTTM